MKERRVLFCAEDVQAIRERKKTQFRVPILPQPILVGDRTWEWPHVSTPLQEGETNNRATMRKRMSWASWAKSMPAKWVTECMARFCPYGAPGTALFGQEAWTRGDGMNANCDPKKPTYAADWPDADLVVRFNPADEMPLAHSRLALVTRAVRVERTPDGWEFVGTLDVLRRPDGTLLPPSEVDR